MFNKYHEIVLYKNNRGLFPKVNSIFIKDSILPTIKYFLGGRLWCIEGEGQTKKSKKTA